MNRDIGQVEPNYSRAGYSLLEVLIAFAVMSLVLTALIPGQAQLLQRATSADEEQLAHDYLLSQIDAYLVLGLPPGSVSKDYRSWKIRVESERVFLGDIEAAELTLTARNRANVMLAQITRLLPLDG